MNLNEISSSSQNRSGFYVYIDLLKNLNEIIENQQNRSGLSFLSKFRQSHHTKESDKIDCLLDHGFLNLVTKYRLTCTDE